MNIEKTEIDHPSIVKLTIADNGQLIRIKYPRGRNADKWVQRMIDIATELNWTGQSIRGKFNIDKPLSIYLITNSGVVVAIAGIESGVIKRKHE